EYALFANYYFDKTIRDKAFKSKQALVSSAFNQITNITNGKIKPDETSMARFVTTVDVYHQSCEFHSTNNLDKFYTDETSMTRFATKEHV
ncbi:MAG: hypothetical protein PWR04_1780, partial [Anaerophaga sp.]|nr:hypothetical protein [Anaerophaga sp.]